MTAEHMRFALFLLVALVPSLVLHEFAHAWMADRQGDQTPRRYGRLTLNPKPHIDVLGSVILPGFLLILAAAGGSSIPFAYGKPQSLNPYNMPDPVKGMTRVALAGPVVNLVLAAGSGLAFRAVNTGYAGELLFAFLAVNLLLCVLNLMPIPGLDGSKLLARFLHGRAREVYVSLDQYLPLFMLLVFFLLAAPVLGFVGVFTRALYRLFAGDTLPPFLK